MVLVQLTHKINWREVEHYFGPFYSNQGRPSVPTRTMVGLMLYIIYSEKFLLFIKVLEQKKMIVIKFIPCTNHTFIVWLKAKNIKHTSLTVIPSPTII
jgi:hypothetical protein